MRNLFDDKRLPGNVILIGMNYADKIGLAQKVDDGDKRGKYQRKTKKANPWLS